MGSDWYETFFTPLALDFWAAAVQPQWTQQEAGFIEKQLSITPPARLLDLPCGRGRHALALAARGFAVTGFDLAASEIAFARAAAGSLPATLAVGDMRQPIAGAPFDGAYCFGNSFGYLAHEDTRRFVRNVFAALRPGARWAIDTGIAAESLLPNLKMERTLELGDITFTVKNQYDAAGSRLISETLLSRGQQVEKGRVIYSIYTCAEIRRLLEGEGFRVISASGALDGKPYALGDPRLLLVAER